MFLTVAVVVVAAVGVIAMLVSVGFVWKALEHQKGSLGAESQRLRSELWIALGVLFAFSFAGYGLVDGGVVGAIWALVGLAVLFVVTVPIHCLARGTASLVERRIGGGTQPAAARSPSLRRGAQRATQSGASGLGDILRGTRAELRAELTRSERAVWYISALGQLLLLPAVIVVALAGGGMSSTALVGVLVGTLIVYAAPVSSVLQARVRRRRKRAGGH